MYIPDDADFTEYLAVGQTVYYARFAWEAKDLPEYQVQKVSAKRVVIIETTTEYMTKEGRWQKRRKTEQELRTGRGWTMDLEKLRKDIWLCQRDYDLYRLDLLRNEIGDTVVKLAELTEKRDALANELGVLP